MVASWLSTSYVGHDVKITFDTNGGSFTDSITVRYGYNYGGLPTPTKDGCIFDGWHFNKTKITASTTVNTYDDHTLITKWSYSDSADTIRNDIQNKIYLAIIIFVSVLLVVILISITILYTKKKED